MNKSSISKAFLWSFIGAYGNQLVLFVVGVVLARILSPKDFGLISVVLVFANYGQIMIDLGFSQAIIQDQKADDADLSTVFFLNLIVGIILAAVLFASSSSISEFYGEPRLTVLIRVLTLIFLLFSISSIQRTLLIKAMDFKSESRIIVSASLISGIIAIIMALRGFGVWALVAKVVMQRALESLFLWRKGSWRPAWIFRNESLKKYFRFSINITGSALVNGLTANIDRLIVGKITSFQSLGFYDRGVRYNNLLCSSLGNVFGRVMFPALSQVKEDSERFQKLYKQVLGILYFFTLPFFVSIFMIARPLIVALITEKWLPSVPIFKILLLVAFTYPVSMVMIKAIVAQGRADLALKLDVLKVAGFIGAIFAGSSWGLTGIAVAIALMNLAGFIINIAASSQVTGMRVMEHIRDLGLPLLNTALMALVVYGALKLMPDGNIVRIFIGLTCAVLSYSILSYLFNRIKLLESIHIVKTVFRTGAVV